MMEEKSIDMVLENLSREELIDQVKKLQDEKKILQSRLKYDSLTGFVRSEDDGRTYLFDRIEQARLASKRITLLRLDLDKLKEWNDRYGHPRVDELLSLFGGKFWKIIGEDNIAIRFHTKRVMSLEPLYLMTRGR